VPTPAVNNATDGSMPINNGTNTVAPKATNKNWIPTKMRFGVFEMMAKFGLSDGFVVIC